MLELAVANGVKVVVLTTHTDCAAEKVAGDPALAAKYPNLARAVHDRDVSVQRFLDRPAIRGAIEEGRLLVQRIAIDTPTDHLVVRGRRRCPEPLRPGARLRPGGRKRAPAGFRGIRSGCTA